MAVNDYLSAEDFSEKVIDVLGKSVDSYDMISLLSSKLAKINLAIVEGSSEHKILNLEEQKNQP